MSGLTTCAVCRRPFTSQRAAEYCSPKCRRRREYEREQWDLRADMYRQAGLTEQLDALGPRP